MHVYLHHVRMTEPGRGRKPSVRRSQRNALWTVTRPG
jgi:hypothetical protein